MLNQPNLLFLSKKIHIKIYGITLLSEDNDIPSWNPIIGKNENIELLKLLFKIKIHVLLDNI